MFVCLFFIIHTYILKDCCWAAFACIIGIKGDYEYLQMILSKTVESRIFRSLEKLWHDRVCEQIKKWKLCVCLTWAGEDRPWNEWYVRISLLTLQGCNKELTYALLYRVTLGSVMVIRSLDGLISACLCSRPRVLQQQHRRGAPPSFVIDFKQRWRCTDNKKYPYTIYSSIFNHHRSWER